jgi:opine dehydrogenase
MSLGRIAVLGGGNGAHALAADMALRGFEVALAELPAFSRRVAKVLRTRSIEVSGVGRTGKARLALATTDVGKALEGAEVVNFVMPAMGQEPFLRAAVPHLMPGQVVILWPGNSGSLLAYRLLQRAGKRGVVVAETNTLPYGCRLTGPGRVSIGIRGSQVHLAAMPASQTAKARRAAGRMYPGMMKVLGNVLAVALSNPNPLVHPPGTLLNLGRIEHARGDFYLYKEGVTQSVCRLVQGLCREAKVLGDRLGTKLISYPRKAYFGYGSIMCHYFDDVRRQHASGFHGPASLDDRYITEDVPFGLATFALLGAQVGVDMPLTRALVEVASQAAGRDFWKEARTPRDLGIAGMTASQLRRYVETGARS